MSLETVQILSSDEDEVTVKVSNKTPKRSLNELNEDKLVEKKDDNPSKRQKLNDSIDDGKNLSDDGKDGKNLSTLNENEQKEAKSKFKSDLEEITELFNSSEEVRELLIICYKKLKADNIKKTYMKKIRLLKTHFDNLKDYVQTEEFKNCTKEKILTSKDVKTSEALPKFIDLFNELEIASKRKKITGSEKIVKKLEHFLEKLHKKIAELEETEVNFDDEENSTYIQVQKYRDRAVEVYRKLCKYYNENEYAGDLTKSKIDFDDSDYLEINRAINKTYKDGKKFPNYYDMEVLVRKCVKKNNMKMSEAEIKIEAQSCFKKLGNLLQRRRQIELHNLQMSYLKNNDEPPHDPELIEKLNAHKAEASKTISKICDEFVKLQEEGKEVELSEDSDNSNYVVSDDEAEN